ncbi:YhbD family protein [Anaerobacillus sp. CMMVII]|uniref:YhbD family protein n=1 Tax=Anaerobacillus sp. CMMVII TaxID=2755588 RepID=UPI0021B79D5E|nr:YhbD family protein [Anaerobacillus sp. CMMVII]MCT8138357.1 YhbD family protein [Anaerobacillus sp. CMMVII]
MDEQLISKKDLLNETGISYGQLYRWKRKNLVPEDWFIRKSTFTGQETFFPREKILERIDKIINLKDGLSLDELADMFSDSPTELTLSKDELTKRNIVSKVALSCFFESLGERKEFSFELILYVYVLDELLQSGEIGLVEGKQVLQTLKDHYSKFGQRSCELVLVRKMGIAMVFLISSSEEFFIEGTAKIAVRLPMSKVIESLKKKIIVGGVN